MQKRLISIFLVFILLFSFPLVSSADSFSWIDLFYEHMELNFDIISELLNSNGNHGPSKERLKPNSSHRDNYDKVVSSSAVVNAPSMSFPGRDGTLNLSRARVIKDMKEQCNVDVSGYKWFGIACNRDADIFIYFLPSNTAAELYITQSDFDNLTFTSSSNGTASYLTNFYTFAHIYYWNPWYEGTAYNEVANFGDYIELSSLAGYYTYDPKYIVFNDLPTHFIDSSPAFHFESQITQSGNNVRTTIACILDDPDQRDSIDLSGYSCSSGIVYHDPSGSINGYPSSDYFFFDFATVNYPEPNVIFKQTFNFNLKDLENYRKRNRLDSLDNFYIFTQVMDSDYETVHYRQQLVNWSLVDDGIFSDVEDLPPYEPPEPSGSPSFPDISFDYNPTNNYYTYNTENIENYDFSQHGDDFSSFFQWFNGAFGTFNANFNGLIDAFNGNLKLFSDNMMDFTVELGDFIEGGFVDINTYLGSLIDKVDVDFNNQINALGAYFGNVMDIINRNVTVIVDNITANIELMFKPDPDYMRALLSDHLVWYYQIRDLFQSKNYSASSFTLFLPGLDYTYEFDDTVMASQIKQILTYCLFACTAASCVRIGFQIFGIHIHSGGDD